MTYGQVAFLAQPPKRSGWRWSMDPPTLAPRATFHPISSPNAIQRLLQRWMLGIYWDKEPPLIQRGDND